MFATVDCSCGHTQRNPDSFVLVRTRIRAVYIETDNLATGPSKLPHHLNTVSAPFIFGCGKIVAGINRKQL